MLYTICTHCEASHTVPEPPTGWEVHTPLPCPTCGAPLGILGSPRTPPTDQLFWHLVVALHHLTAALALHAADGGLPTDEMLDLIEAGDAIGAAMCRLAADDDEDA